MEGVIITGTRFVIDFDKFLFKVRCSAGKAKAIYCIFWKILGKIDEEGGNQIFCHVEQAFWFSRLSVM